MPKRWGGGMRTQLPPGPVGGGVGGVAPGRAGTPGSPPASRGSRAGSPSVGERLEQEVYGAALSDANGLKPIKRDGFM